jgi:glycosyltransferase involved in cell wall biosynthesis
MGELVIGWLRRKGFEPVVAYYEPYSVAPRLSVPSFALLTRKPGCNQSSHNGVEAHAIGAWLPELEFTDYLATKHWKRVIESCTFHVAVAGSCLQALPFALTGTPFLAWVATPWESDRAERVLELPLLRRMFDRVMIQPAARRMQRRVLQSGRFLALSEYTRRELDRIAGREVVSAILPTPVNSLALTPQRDRVEPGLIGFSGRYNDTRKNVDLFLASIAILCYTNRSVRAVLMGGTPNQTLRDRARSLGILDRVQFLDHLPRTEYERLLQTIDVFVIPSHQEGLCISGLEALAVGCPVVSTRCGGPEEYVRDGETGYLSGSEPNEFAAAIGRIVADRELRARLSIGARAVAEREYSVASAEGTFWKEFGAAFPGAI